MHNLEVQMSSLAKVHDVPGATALTDQERELIKLKRQQVLKIFKDGRSRYLERQRGWESVRSDSANEGYRKGYDSVTEQKKDK
jgi:hypothetical protein